VRSAKFRCVVCGALAVESNREGLITQRSLVQIQPPQASNDKGLALSRADPFVVSAPILLPLHRVNDELAARRIAEYQLIELPRFGRVRVGHEVPVPVERRLD